MRLVRGPGELGPAEDAGVGLVVYRKNSAVSERSAVRAGAAIVFIAAMLPLGAQQSFTGRISDSTCGRAHQAHRTTGSQTDRECLLACINALAKYVLVDDTGAVMPIVNQEAMGLPLYAGRPVKITGERQGDAIMVAKIEAIAAHLHLGHVMTNWRDTPGARGFLPVAIDEARVAALHADLAAKSTAADDLALHAGHVLNALDPSIEPRGPGAGYGVKKAVAGAQQHLDLALKSEGATPAIAADATAAAAALADALRLTEEAIALAQSVRAAAGASDAARRAADLAALADRIGGEALTSAQSRMTAILRAENLLGAPR